MPATANFLSKLSHGKADDLATATILASDKDIFLVPAMNVRMWVHPATQENYKTLKGFGYNFIGPEKGEMACGEYGDGKMSSPRQILKEIQLYFKNSYFLKDKKLKALVTTGPTREYIDKVRYVSNNSSGKQGYELAKSLHRSGVDTTLVMGPTNLDPIKNLKIIKVKTANEMLNAVKSLLPVDIAICAAAVSDFKPKKTFKGKIKKNDDKIDKLELEKNPDILEFLGKNNRNRPKLVVGFAAEVENVILNAKNKLISKNCDWIVANDVSKADTGFDVDNNKVILLDKNGEKINIDKNKKNFIAAKITDKILKNFLMNKEELN